MKICSKCNTEKLLDYFYKNKNKIDGYNVWCKQCMSSQHKKLYADKSEHIKQKINSYYYNNKDIIAPKLKEYRNRLEVKNKQQQYIKEWVENNKNHYRQYQNEYARNRRKNDNTFRIIENLKLQIYHYLKKQVKNDKTEVLLGYTYSDLDNLHLTTKKYNRTKKNTFSDIININYYKKAHKWIIKSRLSKISTYL